MTIKQFFFFEKNKTIFLKIKISHPNSHPIETSIHTSYCYVMILIFLPDTLYLHDQLCFVTDKFRNKPNTIVKIKLWLSLIHEKHQMTNKSTNILHATKNTEVTRVLSLHASIASVPPRIYSQHHPLPPYLSHSSPHPRNSHPNCLSNTFPINLFNLLYHTQK